MRTSKHVRILGLVLLLTGLFLIVFMGAIAIYLAPSMLNPGEEESGTRFTGTAGDANIIFILFGLVMAFGAGSSLNGLWQIIRGRTNKWLAYGSIILCVLLVVFAYSLELIMEW